MIKAIFFDLDDTLLWDKKSIALAFEQTCRLATEEDKTIDPFELEKVVREEAKALYESYETYAFTSNIGINPFEGLWGQFRDEEEGFQALREIAPSYQLEAWSRGLTRMGNEDQELAQKLSKQFPLERRKHPIVFEDTFSTLDQLKQDFKLLLLTNGSSDLQNTKLEITPQLVPYFDHILISGAYGEGKPGSMMFQEALELANLSSDEAVMVGDNLSTDTKGANAAGIKSVWLNRDRIRNQKDVEPDYMIHQLNELLSLSEIKGAIAK